MSTYYPTLKQFFLAHGIATRKPRVVLPYLDECFKYVNKWILGTLPDGKRNLSINIPPRHGKTFLARDTIAYTMGVWPDSEFIYVSYAAKLAIEQTDAIRATLNSDWYQYIFSEVGTVEGTKDRFKTKHGGAVYGAGMDGSLTGFGAGRKRKEFGGAIIIDDILNASDATSEVERTKANNWYTGTLLSRKNHSNTPILNISQRLHPEDIVGHLKEKEAQNWYFLEIPVIVNDEETGEEKTTIWPDTYSLDNARELREMDAFAFWSQYMQTPVIEGGSIIKKEWWRHYDIEAEYKNKTFAQWAIALTGDTAFKAKEANDYSAFQAWCFTPDRLLLLDGIYGKWEFPELVERAKEFYKKWAILQPNRRVEFYIEDKASGTPLCQVLNEAGAMATPWLPREYEFPDDKVSRMKASAIPVYAGHIYLPEGHHYSNVLIEEAAQFSTNDTHTNDDNCDAFTIAVSVWKWLGGNISGTYQ